MNQKENAYVSMMERHQQEFDAFPHFFAFSEAQFSKGMKKLDLTPNDRGMISTFLCAGDYYRKTDLPALIEMMARQSRERQQAIAEDKTGEGFILDMFSQELANHEYSYTQDLTDTLNCLGLTVERINNTPNLLNGLRLALNQIRTDSD